MDKYEKAKQKLIIEYWSKIKYEDDLGVDWVDADKRCWRCGYKRVLSRHHIIPKALGGGEDNISNEVLLCRLCHFESPHCLDLEAVWEWIKDTHLSTYDTFWMKINFEDFEKRYGINLVENIIENRIRFRLFMKNVIKYEKQSCLFFNRFYPLITMGTSNWVYKKSLDEALSQQKLRKYKPSLKIYQKLLNKDIIWFKNYMFRHKILDRDTYNFIRRGK